MYDFKSFKDCETNKMELNIPVELEKDLEFVANSCGRDPEYLINCYIANGLSRIMTKIKSEKFVAHAKKVLEKNKISDTTVNEIISKFLY